MNLESKITLCLRGVGIHVLGKKGLRTGQRKLRSWAACQKEEQVHLEGHCHHLS